MAPIHLGDLLKVPPGTTQDSRSIVLRAVMANPGSQTNLAQRSGLSDGTVSAAVRELEGRKWLAVDRPTAREHLVRVAEVAGAAVGIELGFHLSVVVARRASQTYDQAVSREVGVGAAGRDGRWVSDVADAVRHVVSELGEEDIAAIGLGVPRMVDPQLGVLVPPALPPWHEGDDPAGMLAVALRQDRGAPRLVAPRVLLDNDANLAAYAESVYEYPKVETLLGIKASTGIGAGIIVGGRIFRGRHGVAGEIGHMVVDPGGRFCSCGGRGCLETLIGADALVEQAKTVLGHRTLESPQTLEALVDMAARGNLACQRVLREAAGTLGFAIGNLCNVFNPDVVVLGGAFGRAEAVRFTLGPLKHAVTRSALAAAVGDLGVSVWASKLPYAAAHGALVMALAGTEYE
jgi:predicted NBD/HSP70 family sugar kinase